MKKTHGVEHLGEFVLLRPDSNTLDVGTAAEFKKTLLAVARTHEASVLVDLSAICEIDSSGLGALVAGLKAARSSGGAVRLFGVRPEVREVMALTMIDRVLPLFDTVEDAMEDAGRDREGACATTGAGPSGTTR